MALVHIDDKKISFKQVRIQNEKTIHLSHELWVMIKYDKYKIKH